MTHKYIITGMTCDGCRIKVEKKISIVDGVTKASVNLERAEATIEMERHIEIDKFQEALKDSNYNIAHEAEEPRRKK